MWSRVPLTCIWFSVGHILTTFPPCTPIGESMTVLNTADWLLGCSSPSPATGSKEYGTEVHVCEYQTEKSTVMHYMHKGCLSLLLASHGCLLVVFHLVGFCRSCSDWFWFAVNFLSALWIPLCYCIPVYYSVWSFFLFCFFLNIHLKNPLKRMIELWWICRGSPKISDIC